MTVDGSRAPRTADSSFANEEVRVIGARRRPLRDLYHAFLRAPWWAALGAIVVAYLGLNAIFALGFLAVGGVENARPGSFADALYFSVQTLGTIGYGAMHPRSAAANLLVLVESVAGLIITAVATGLVFAKFSQTAGRIVFSRAVTISPVDGVPTLAFRVGNERSSSILEAMVRVALVRTETTKEGVLFYRMYDLVLTRERSPALSRSWMAMHQIKPESPLYGETPRSIAEKEIELLVTIVGTDDTSRQPVHARHRYVDTDIVWGARHADVLTIAPDGVLIIDVGKFHDIVPTESTEEFPYSMRTNEVATSSATASG
jgi:inward rectifier potassium channel